MDSKSALTRFSRAPIIPLILLALSLPSEAGDTEKISPDALNGQPVHFIRDGRIMELGTREFTRLRIAGRVERIFETGDVLYYLRSDGADLFLGYLELSGAGDHYEGKIPESIPAQGIRRFFAAGGAGYILTRDGVLSRVGLGDMSVRSRKGVIDAVISGWRLVLLEPSAAGTVLNCNGSRVPVTITGEIFIQSVTEGRIVTLSNGRESEIMDLLAVKSVYQYAPGEVFALPDGFNLAINAVSEYDDTAPQGERDMVFYKVFIDGTEKGRTETGLPSTDKGFRDMVGADTYHLIRLEKWFLDRVKGKYNRENNLYQPAPLYLYVPGNRVVQVLLKFNGKGYTVRTSQMMK